MHIGYIAQAVHVVYICSFYTVMAYSDTASTVDIECSGQVFMLHVNTFYKQATKGGNVGLVRCSLCTLIGFKPLSDTPLHTLCVSSLVSLLFMPFPLKFFYLYMYYL